MMFDVLASNACFIYFYIFYQYMLKLFWSARQGHSLSIIILPRLCLVMPGLPTLRASAA